MDRKWKMMWALANEMWGRDLADELLHYFAALNFGKVSLRELTEEEVGTTLHWLKETLGKSN